MKKAKQQKQILVILSVLVLVLFISILANLLRTKVDFEGFEEVRLQIGLSAAVLIKDCIALPIIISLDQTYSIAQGMIGEKGIRPNSHDLIKSVLEDFKIEVIAVKVTEIRNSTYYAELVLKQGNKVFSVDSRPSDAIAMAVRVNAPIYVKDDLLLEYGENICPSEKEKITMEF